MDISDMRADVLLGIVQRVLNDRLEVLREAGNRSPNRSPVSCPAREHELTTIARRLAKELPSSKRVDFMDAVLKRRERHEADAE
jgi:DNA-binding HxlR family transcriptional regulator